MPKQVKREHDKEDSSASFNIFFTGDGTGEVAAVQTCSSGEGKGSHCGQCFAFQRNLTAGTHQHLPPSARTEHF